MNLDPGSGVTLCCPPGNSQGRVFQVTFLDSKKSLNLNIFLKQFKW
jgi:hypothetical protein